MVLGMLLFSAVGYLFWDVGLARPVSSRPLQPPSSEHPLGTDKLGRDMLAVVIVGTPRTLEVGFIAGVVGLAIGTVLAFTSAYYGGVLDLIIRWVVDVGLTIPGLMILILLAISFEGLSVHQMGLVVAATAWLGATRTMRSQVLSIKQRAYVEVARMSGMPGLKVIVKELLPNLMPYLAAGLVSGTFGGILASIGLEALGLGPADTPTLGMTIYWVILYSGVLHGYWWWWMPPIVVILLVFVGLFLTSLGMDEFANPRRRTRA
jgi:peptide/nickel transport system permease protein